MHVLELKIPPLAQLAISALGMWIAARRWPTLALAFPARHAVAIALVAAGIVVALAGVVAFRRARTTTDPTRPGRATAFIASGIYRRSRNPMYLGFLLALSGWAWFLANAGAVLVLPVFVAYLTRFQIAPEERILGGKFGREYEHYRRTVRRWL
jgi:protein-S-isoprenylcysteine O-methyltransferase Ste14